MPDAVGPIGGNPALSPADASRYCGCSQRHFERWIAPFLPVVDLRATGGRKPMPRYRLADLDRWLDGRRAGTDRPESAA